MFDKVDHLPGFSGPPRSCEAGPEGRSPQTRDTRPLGCPVERRVALVPDILSHHLGPGSPTAKRPLSERKHALGPSYVQVSVPSPGGRGLVLTSVLQPFQSRLLSSVSSALSCGPRGQWFIPLSGVPPGASHPSREAVALGSGLAGLAVSP